MFVIFSGFCVCGLIVRNSIKDRCNDEKARDNFNVAYLSEDLMGLMEHVDEDLEVRIFLLEKLRESFNMFLVMLYRK